MRSIGWIFLILANVFLIRWALSGDVSDWDDDAHRCFEEDDHSWG